jgi:hypothetical protein
MGVHQGVGLADEDLIAHHELEVGLELDEAHVVLRLSHGFLLDFRFRPLSVAPDSGTGRLSWPPRQVHPTAWERGRGRITLFRRLSQPGSNDHA